MVGAHRRRRCPCGRHGCVEAYAGRAAMESGRASCTSTARDELFDLMEAAKRDRLSEQRLGRRRSSRTTGWHGELIADAYEALAAGVGLVMNLLDWTA